jgi:hypothetical protein
VLTEGDRVAFGASMKLFDHHFRPEDVATLDDVETFLNAEPAARCSETVPDPGVPSGFREIVARSAR